MNKERSAMLGGMDVKKLLIKLAIPATIAMMANALYNLVDTIFVARGAGEIAIGALAIVFPIQMIVMAIGLMIGIGSASVFSRAYGRGDEDSMTRVVNTALLLNVIVSVLITILSLVFVDDLLIFFGATVGENFDYAKEYIVFVLIGLVPFSSAIVLNNLTRAEGRANVAMISLLIGALVNIALDPIFIFDWGFGMGVRGAALATLIAKSMSFIYVFREAISKRSALNIKLRTIHKFDFKMTREIAAIGAPTFVRNTLGAVLVIIINNLINYYAALSGVSPGIYISIYGVINRMIMFLLLPGFGLVQGLIPIVGFNFGAKFHRRLYEVISYGVRLIFIYFVAIFVITLIFAEILFVLFSRDGDMFFIKEGAKAFRIISVGFTMIGFQVVLSSIYQAMGYPVRAFLVALSRQFILFIPLVFLLTWLMQRYFDDGIAGIWLTFLVADVIAGSLSYLVYRYEMRDLKRKIPKDDLAAMEA